MHMVETAVVQSDPAINWLVPFCMGQPLLKVVDKISVFFGRDVAGESVD